MKSNQNFGVNGFGQEAIVFCQSEMGLIQKQSRNISKISVHRANARSAIHPHSHEWGISRILLKGWIEQLGLAERIGVCLFVEAYARCERMNDYGGKVALERYLARLRMDCELRKTFLKWTRGALAAANTPSKKRSA